MYNIITTRKRKGENVDQQRQRLEEEEEEGEKNESSLFAYPPSFLPSHIRRKAEKHHQQQAIKL